MEDWKRRFAERLSEVQLRWATQFDEAVDNAVVPVFNEMTAFLRDNGVQTAIPLHDKGRRSFKFELAEDAYLLLIFRARAVGEFELSREVFVLGCEPQVRRSTERVSSLTEKWVRKEFQSALDAFVEQLDEAPVAPEAEVAVV